MPEKQYYIYILCNKRNGTIYTGITSDLIKRIWQHKNGIMEGFTKRYGLKSLVYYEAYKVEPQVEAQIDRKEQSELG